MTDKTEQKWTVGVAVDHGFVWALLAAPASLLGFMAVAGLRKLRVGDYRVIFAILGPRVLVLRVGRRSEIYDR